MIEANPRRWEALPVILVATFMGLFDVFVVNVAAEPSCGSTQTLTVTVNN